MECFRSQLIQNQYESRVLSIKDKHRENLSFDVQRWIDENKDLISSISSIESSCPEKDEKILRDLLWNLSQTMKFFRKNVPIDIVNKLLKINIGMKRELHKFVEMVQITDNAEDHPPKKLVKLPITLEMFTQLNDPEAIYKSYWNEETFLVNKNVKSFEWFLKTDDSTTTTSVFIDLKKEYTNYIQKIKKRAIKRGQIISKTAFEKGNESYLKENHLDTNTIWKLYNETWYLILFGTNDETILHSILKASQELQTQEKEYEEERQDLQRRKRAKR